ncbi:MAG: type II toxin-antitoxin system RelE/ParE family toxin [Caldilinea sp. CFX5]|nr:type II toxin-antitoxin system RelE/ParE family toxin [Caldilinea sp. CFX5]
MRYQLKIDKHVAREIQQLPGHIRQRVLHLIDQLLTDPRPAIAKQLQGQHADKWQVALDAWRVVYRIEDDMLIVEVLKIGKKHGPEFYKDLSTM